MEILAEIVVETLAETPVAILAEPPVKPLEAATPQAPQRPSAV